MLSLKISTVAKWNGEYTWQILRMFTFDLFIYDLGGSSLLSDVGEEKKTEHKKVPNIV